MPSNAFKVQTSYQESKGKAGNNAMIRHERRRMNNAPQSHSTLAARPTVHEALASSLLPLLMAACQGPSPVLIWPIGSRKKKREGCVDMIQFGSPAPAPSTCSTGDVQ